MIVLKIYLISTAISWLVIGTYSIACAYKIKREGYKPVKQNKSFAEKFVNWLFTLIRGSIPILNVAASLMIIFEGDKVYEEAKEDMLKKGKIYMPEEPKVVIEVEPEEQETVSEEQEDFKNAKKEDFIKNFENMTYRERITFLKNEKERVLRQEHTMPDDMFQEDQVESGPVLRQKPGSKNNK